MKKAIKIISIIIGAVLLIGIIGLIIMINSGPKPAEFTYLQEPRIIDKPDVQSIKVDFDGDADVVLKAAFGKLYKVYYALKNVPKWKGQPAPIARYENFDAQLDALNIETIKDLPWKGFIAIPVPQSISSLPDEFKSAPYPVRLETLTYGMVGEIVHFGAYEDETPTINQLKQYITNQGYEITGLHEEEYIKGPGLPFVKPNDYITIIRYQVAKLR